MSSADPSPPLRPVAHLPRFASARAIGALMMREMATTYGRSPGGYLWAVLEPVAAILLLSFLFSLGFRSPPLGSSFAIFFATGFLPFFMFVEVNNRVALSLSYSKQLLNYPRVTFIDAILARFFLTALTRLLISVVILAAILLYTDTRTILILPEIAAAFALAAGLGLGTGILNALLFLRFPIWQSVWSILTRPLVLISGVIFLIERIPDPYGSWLEWNPLAHITVLARHAFYYGYRAEYLSPAYVLAWALPCAVIGLLFLRRYHRDFLER